MYRILSNFIALFFQCTHRGLLTFVGMGMAIIVINVYPALYCYFIKQDLQFFLGLNLFSLSINRWISEFLMMFFFLTVATEIKREILEGHLQSRSQRILPVVSACLGAIFPILIYVIFNYHDDLAMRAWAIPTATDIVFALSTFMVFNTRWPMFLRIFLMALATIDDLIAIIIIVLFYGNILHFNYFLPILSCLLILFLCNRFHIVILSPYMIIGLFTWYYFFKSGVHSTFSGVTLGFFIPLKIFKYHSPLIKLEKIMSPYIRYIVLPLFAFANSGISLRFADIIFLFHPVAIGSIIGLTIGKIVGICLSIYFLKTLKIIYLPRYLQAKYYYYISVFCGIGFTMSLFIGSIALEYNAIYLEIARSSIILGSLISIFLAILSARIFK